MATTPDRGYPKPEGGDPFTPRAAIADLADAVDADVEAVASKADTAVQPGDLAPVATSGDYDDLTGKPTLGTAAATAATDYATAAQGAKADTAVQVTGTPDDGDLVSWDDAAQEWVPIPAGSIGGAIPESVVDAKGDLILGTAADTVARLPVGATNGHVLTVDSAEAGGMKWAAPAEQLLPRSATITGATPALAKSSFVAGYVLQFSGTVWQASVQGAYVEFDVLLDAGTYDLTMVGSKNNIQAIATFTLNGSALTTIDTYAASFTANNFMTVTGLTIPGGRHVLRVATPTRNASSSGWVLNFNAIQLVRTGA